MFIGLTFSNICKVKYCKNQSFFCRYNGKMFPLWLIFLVSNANLPKIIGFSMPVGCKMQRDDCLRKLFKIY